MPRLCEGDTIEGRTLVRFLGNGWLARCARGHRAVVQPRQLAGTTCRKCRPKLPHHCRWCGKRDPRKFQSRKKSVCAACQKAGERNGYCGCGRPRRRKPVGNTGSIPVPCPCGAA